MTRPPTPWALELAGCTPRRVRDEIDAAETGFSYACRRCEVWGRVPAGASRRCWLCDRADRLERR